MARRAKSKEPVDHRLFYREPIADYIIAFGSLEEAMDQVIAILIESKHPRKAELAIAQLINFTTKIKLLVALTAITTKKRKHLNAVNRLKDTLYEINTYRNHIVHGAWNRFSARHRGKRLTHLVAEKVKIHPRKLTYYEFQATPNEIRQRARKVRSIPHKLFQLATDALQDRDPSLYQPRPLVIRLLRHPKKKPQGHNQ